MLPANSASSEGTLTALAAPGASSPVSSVMRLGPSAAILSAPIVHDRVRSRCVASASESTEAIVMIDSVIAASSTRQGVSSAASEIGVQFTAEKAIDIATTVKLEATPVVTPSSTEKPTTK